MAAIIAARGGIPQVRVEGFVQGMVLLSLMWPGSATLAQSGFFKYIIADE
jgi:hypothetical protein